MMRRQRTPPPLAAIVSLLLGAAPMIAAEVDPSPVHFTVFALRPIDEISFQPKPAAPPEPVKFYPTARSPELSYVGEMPIAFTDSQSGDVVASAAIPTHITKALLIFVPVESGLGKPGRRYQVQVLDDGTLRQSPGGVAFINLSGLTLVGNLGTRPLTLGVGLSATFPADGGAVLSLATEHRGRRFRSYFQSIDLAAGERALFILFPPYYVGSFEVQGRMLIDTPPDPTKAKAPQTVYSP